MTFLLKIRISLLFFFSRRKRPLIGFQECEVNLQFVLQASAENAAGVDQAEVNVKVHWKYKGAPPPPITAMVEWA